MIYVSPQDDLIEVVISHLNQARKRVWISVYVFSLPIIMADLVGKVRKKMDVKVIVSDHELNDLTVKYLRSHHVPVKIWHQYSGTLHMKLMIFDDVALIGSANLTHYGLNRSLEILVEVKDQKSLKKLEDIFLGLWRVSES